MRLLLVLLLLSPYVHAELTLPRPECSHDKVDPHDPSLEFAEGKFRGQCVDATTVRAVRIADETEDSINLINFYHDGKFWRAQIPKKAVAKVYFHIVPFDSGVPLIRAAHTQFRFILNEGVHIPLAAQNSETVTRVPDLIVSSTYIAPPGVEYEAMKSLSKGYGIVTRAMSSHARGLEEIVKDKSIVRQFEMKLSQDEKNRLLVLALRRASGDGYSMEYGLLNNNCTTIAFDILDEMRPRPKGVPAMRGSLWRIRDEFEGPSIEALKARGLIDDGSEIRPMNDERKWE